MESQFDLTLKQLNNKDNSLTTLDLDYSQINETGAKDLAIALEKNTSLTTLNLEHGRIKDAGVKYLAGALKKNTSLTTLYLEGNHITEAGAKDLANALEKNTNLTTLSLSNNDIGEIGAKYLADALEKNTSLKALDLWKNQITDVGAKYLANALKKNTSLTSFYLENNPIKEAGVQSLADALKKNTSLTTLYLGHNSINDGGAKSLASALKKNTSLTTLSLQLNNINAAGAKSLVDALKKNTSLTTLNLAENKINDTDAKDLADALQINTNLTILNLSCSHINDAGAKSLANALKKNASLTTLSLDGNHINEAGAEDLASALQKNTSLTTLDLYGNQMKDAGAKSLASALEKNTSLTTLYLGDSQINDPGAKYLAKALKKNTSLTTLSLGDNDIYDAGTKSLASALQINTSLTTLDLGDCQINDVGAKYLADALKKNTSLITLDLIGNEINDAGTKLLEEALKTNYSLLTLKGIDSLAISSYLERNNKIAQGLSVLHEAIDKDCMLLDEQAIALCLDQIVQNVQNLDELPEDAYLVEACRILTALGHSGTYGAQAQVEALPGLLPSFKHQGFQKLADKSLGLLLTGSLNETIARHTGEHAGPLLSLYGFRNHLSSPEIKRFAQMALFKLVHGNKNYTYQEKQALEEETIILTQQAVLSLLEKALETLNHEKPEANETLLIRALIDSQMSYASCLARACQSVTFINTFKTQYPKAERFTTPEHCLLTASNQGTAFLVDITPEVTEDDLADCALQLVNGTSKKLVDIVNDLKGSLEKIYHELTKGDITSEISPKATENPQSNAASNPFVFFQKSSQSNSVLISNYTDIIDKITDFYNQPGYNKVDGLVKMKAIIENNSLKKSEKIAQLVDLAQWKKSDSSPTAWFHHHIRNRALEVEGFYQKLAILNINNQTSVSAFMNNEELRDTLII